MPNKELIEILKRTKGLFPTSIDNDMGSEVKSEATPPFWDDPLQILRNDKIVISKIKVGGVQFTEEEISNLSMAAREGTDISENVRKRMSKDKKNARK